MLHLQPNDVAGTIETIDAVQKPAVPATGPDSIVAKRVLDVLSSIIFLALFAPLMLFLGLLVRLDGSPVLYGHTRIGRHGREFRCLKFRTDGCGLRRGPCAPFG